MRSHLVHLASAKTAIRHYGSPIKLSIMLILGDREIVSILAGLQSSSCHQLLESLSKALLEYSASRNATEKVIHQPPREVVTTAPGHTTLFMPASNTATTGIKIVTLPGNGEGPRGSINIYTPEGSLIGLLNAEEITAFRTGLASMIAFLKCPFPKSRIVVFGAGKQAEWHVRLALLLAGDSVQSITVINRRSSGVERLRKRWGNTEHKYPKVEIRFIAKDEASDYDSELKGALAASDAIMGCTPSTEPLFPASYLSPGDGQRKQRFISLIGSYKPHMQEVDAETLLSGTKIYVDSKEACLEEAGEIIKANVAESQLVELGEMLAQPNIGPLEGNMVYKCVGMGIMDVIVASELLKIAKNMNIGRILEDF
ncbi:uncharacterized protein BCR38DRAFT_440591 [Pseudomassariella vexata]|uniref:Ornithine cyclodeaminase n=1 Tax=Pseudomassariella vexata TaxID=1141098 RepID=A0A1Y2DSC8_9PEZI|nr:uncharacterized protein BCR38DRAFT_440591 [Pseudomassariella vexata]ORY61585.1 hypothetical protein BCR38DRAFT_440591 [Pseudomassariella vexata]